MKRVNSPRVKILFDIYHAQIMDGDIVRNIRDNFQWIGHFHTGGNPGRHEIDDTQELNYRFVMQAIADLGLHRIRVARVSPAEGHDPIGQPQEGDGDLQRAGVRCAMQRGSFSGICAGLALVFGAAMFAAGQEPPGGAQPVPQFDRTPPVDAAAHERGRLLWASHCVDCHGAQARGTEKGPNIIRTKTVNFDRSSPQAGSVLGPFLKAGHPTQSGKPASFTNDEVIALATFLRQRVTDTMRWSTLFVPGTFSSAIRGPVRRTSTAKAGAAHATTRRCAVCRGSRRGWTLPSICSSECSFPAPGAADEAPGPEAIRRIARP